MKRHLFVFFFFHSEQSVPNSILFSERANLTRKKGQSEVTSFMSIMLFSFAFGFATLFLRTVLTIVIAHTFCASRDTRIFYGWYLLIQGYFCAVQNSKAKLRNLESRT